MSSGHAVNLLRGGYMSDRRYPSIDPDRLWENLMELGSIGRGERGVTRLAFTREDLEGRRWLLRKLEEAGLEARIDKVGNVFGRMPAGTHESSRPAKPHILVGSHVDTVPEGGMFDGALGVLAALECATVLKEQGLLSENPLEIVAFSNEEGSRVGPGLFGSRAFAEGLPEEEWKQIRPVLEKAGLLDDGDGSTFLAPSLNPQGYLCYLELHIEQGGILDKAGEDIGVVQGIVGIHTFTALFKGEANHAGTTPMNQRKDALLGASELILNVPVIVRRFGSPATVGTCGQVRVSPGGRNIIPGEVEISVEVRDLDEAVSSRTVEALRDKAREIAFRRGLGLELSGVSKTPGAMMDPAVQDVIEDSAKALGLASRRMPSGAGHDAAVLAKYLRTGMIFVPSRGGISHSPREWTDKEACANGANVLLRTILRLHEQQSFRQRSNSSSSGGRDCRSASVQG